MTDSASYLLDRALAAEQRAEELESQVERLKALIGGAIDMDPTTAIQALNWVGRAETAEKLLANALSWYAAHENLPPSWWAQAEATVRAAELSKRDAPENVERPADDTYFTQELDSSRKPRALAPGSVGSAAARKIFERRQRELRGR